MQKAQKTYTPEFKREAVRLAQTSGKPIAQVARELGISDTSIHQWRKELAVLGPEARRFRSCQRSVTIRPLASSYSTTPFSMRKMGENAGRGFIAAIVLFSRSKYSPPVGQRHCPPPSQQMECYAAWKVIGRLCTPKMMVLCACFNGTSDTICNL